MPGGGDPVVYGPERIASPVAPATDALVPERDGHNLGVTVDQERRALGYIVGFEAQRASLEQDDRVRLFHYGMRARTLRGLHASNWPHGYAAIRNEAGDVTGAEFVDEEIAAVRFVTERFLEGAGYPAIAVALNKTPYRPRRFPVEVRISSSSL